MFVTMMLIAALCGTVTIADSAPIPATVQVDIGPNVDAMLRDLAEQIGVGAEAVYPLYLRQADVFADTCMAVLIGGGILLVIGIILSIVLSCAFDSDAGMLPGIGSILLFIMLAVAVLAVAGDYMMARNNPELWAIRHIASDAAAFVQ